MIFPELIKTVNATTARTLYFGDCTALDRDDLIPQNTRQTARRPSHEKIRRHSTATYTFANPSRHSASSSIGIRQNDRTTSFFFLPAIPSEILKFLPLAALAVQSDLPYIDSTYLLTTRFPLQWERPSDIFPSE